MKKAFFAFFLMMVFSIMITVPATFSYAANWQGNNNGQYSNQHQQYYNQNQQNQQNQQYSNNQWQQNSNNQNQQHSG
jgi:predicted PurR-regulated permease PerM